MPVTKLTKRAVDAIKPNDRRTIYYDDQVKGFCLRVAITGAKVWCVEYRPGSGGRAVSKQRFTIGAVGAFTPDQARAAARDILARVRLGDDPAASRIRARMMPNFREFAERYLEEEAVAKLKPGTVVNYRLYLRKHAFPHLGNKKLDSISGVDLAKLHRHIGQATPMTANRVLECIGSVFRYGASCGLVERGYNPGRYVEAFKENRRERFLTSIELGQLGEAIREAETMGIPWDIDESKPMSKHIPRQGKTIVSPYAAAALRLLILTGARLREILGLRWEYIDLERGLLFLPDSKTGRKTIVLNAPAVAILSQIEKVGAYVISGDDPERPRHDLNRPWKLIAARAGLNGVRLHDLRHTHASVGAAAGLGLPIIGKLLGHTQAATTQRYAHLDADPLRRASNQIGGHIAAAMGESLVGPTH